MTDRELYMMLSRLLSCSRKCASRWYLIPLISISLFSFCGAKAQYITNYAVSTMAGNISGGFANGVGTNASFYGPQGLAVDSLGTVYVADTYNNSIRKIAVDGSVSILAGNGSSGFINKTGTNASFFSPWGVAVDRSGNVYVADYGNNKIRKIDSTGMVSTFAGQINAGFVNGVGVNASFWGPVGVCADGLGIYVADVGNIAVRQIDTNRLVTTLAGNGIAGFVNGSGATTSFRYPVGVAVDQPGNVYVADNQNNAIRKISSNGVVTTLAGNGTGGFKNGLGTNAMFNSPQGVAVDTQGNVYVADYYNHAIRKITTDCVVTTIAGNGGAGLVNGLGTNASFKAPAGVAVDTVGNLYVADSGNNAIRKLTPLYGKYSNIISFMPLAATKYGVVPLTLTATASSGLQISYTSSNSSVATIAGSNIVTIAGAGTATITASQAGNSNFMTAVPVSQILVVNKATNPINFVQPSARTFTNGAGFSLVATAPGGVVSFATTNTNILSILGSTATIHGAGTVTVTASQVGNSNYLAATNVSRTVVINKAPQTITFKPTSPISFANIKSFTLSGSSTSGLTVSYSSSATNIISVSGTTATVRKTGTATLTATQSGNANYNAATPVAVSVTVK